MLVGKPSRWSLARAPDKSLVGWAPHRLLPKGPRGSIFFCLHLLDLRGRGRVIQNLKTSCVVSNPRTQAEVVHTTNIASALTVCHSWWWLVKVFVGMKMYLVDVWNHTLDQRSFMARQTVCFNSYYQTRHPPVCVCCCHLSCHSCRRLRLWIRNFYKQVSVRIVSSNASFSWRRVSTNSFLLRRHLHSIRIGQLTPSLCASYI